MVQTRLLRIEVGPLALQDPLQLLRLALEVDGADPGGAGAVDVGLLVVADVDDLAGLTSELAQDDLEQTARLALAVLARREHAAEESPEREERLQEPAQLELREVGVGHRDHLLAERARVAHEL